MQKFPLLLLIVIIINNNKSCSFEFDLIGTSVERKLPTRLNSKQQQNNFEGTLCFQKAPVF